MRPFGNVEMLHRWIIFKIYSKRLRPAHQPVPHRLTGVAPLFLLQQGPSGPRPEPAMGLAHPTCMAIGPRDTLALGPAGPLQEGKPGVSAIQECGIAGSLLIKSMTDALRG